MTTMFAVLLLALLPGGSSSSCAGCGGAQLCDNWSPGWPGGQVDSAACLACLGQPQSCLQGQGAAQWCASPWTRAHCPLTCCRREGPPSENGSRLLLAFVSQSEQPVIDTLEQPDNLFGFEGGRALKQDGKYWLFTAEMFAMPLDAAMRVALWSAPSASGPWARESTIQQSNQSYTLRKFTQQCNQPYCSTTALPDPRYCNCELGYIMRSPPHADVSRYGASLPLKIMPALNRLEGCCHQPLRDADGVQLRSR
jgi:hypothetical protein